MKRSSWGVLGIVGLGGVACIVGAKGVEEPFWLGFWLNVGVAMLLFASLYIVERLVLDRRVDTAKDEVLAVARTELAAVESDLRLSIDALTDAFADEASRVQTGDDALARAARTDVGAVTVGDLLTRAGDLAAITEGGPRVEIPGQYERLRFSPPTVDGIIRVTIEEWDTRPIVSLAWPSDEGVVSFFARVATALQSNGRYGVGTDFDPARVIGQLVDTLELAIRSRTGRGGGPPDLGPIIEVPVATWAVTDDGIEAVGEHRYVIGRDRVDEAKWFPHVSAKRWVDPDEFDLALETARAIFGNREGHAKNV